MLKCFYLKKLSEVLILFNTQMIASHGIKTTRQKLIPEYHPRRDRELLQAWREGFPRKDLLYINCPTTPFLGANSFYKSFSSCQRR